jgi:Ion transport protein
VLDHWITAIVMTLITIYSLFFDDVRVLAFEPDADSGFYGITSFCMAAFLIEIFLAALVKEDYFLTFFFWLDLVSTISMIPDIGWIWNLITGGGGKSANVASISKTSRASRVTRVIRIVRLIRLIRIVKLYKTAKQAQIK